jgi:hypothetical protein
MSTVVSEVNDVNEFIKLEEVREVLARTLSKVSGTTILTVTIIIDNEKYPNRRNR